MKYLAGSNALYKTIVNRALLNITNPVKASIENDDTYHPLRLISEGLIYPLHTVFSSPNDILSKSIVKTMMQEDGLYETIQKLAWKSPIFVNNYLPDSDITFPETVSNLIKILFSHFYLINEANVYSEQGKTRQVTSFYKKVTCATRRIINDVERVIDGYYVFLGKTPIVIAAYKPNNETQNTIEIFTKKNLKNFPLSNEILFIYSLLEKPKYELPVSSLTSEFKDFTSNHEAKNVNDEEVLLSFSNSLKSQLDLI